ncbi:hypothetical protein GOV05_03585, partial [Candidatus Woesearchaeota archaeon]|nr:hypothetical protein [Candidatus Woesearchaeota archaeon]
DDGNYVVWLHITDLEQNTASANLVINSKADNRIGTSKSKLYVQTFLEQEQILAGKQNVLYYKLLNQGSRKIRDAKITVSIVDLGFIRTFRIGDLSVNKRYSGSLWLDIPNWAPRGEYEIRFSVHGDNGNTRRVKYLFTQIV